MVANQMAAGASFAEGEDTDARPVPTAWETLSDGSDLRALSQAWLGLLAHSHDAVEVGLVLVQNPSDHSYVPAAIWPDPLTDASHLTVAAQQALTERRGVEIPPSTQPDATGGMARHTQLAIPIETEQVLRGVVVVGLAGVRPMVLQDIRQSLLWGSAWLTQHFYREAQRQSGANLDRVGLALDLALIALEKLDFQESAMAVVNELAVKLAQRRVSLGLAVKGDVRVQALSNTAYFKRHTEFIQTIECAMEEAFDQRRDVHFPPFENGPQGQFAVTSDHERLVKQQGGGGAASFILFHQGEPFGVLTLESPPGNPMGQAEWALGTAYAKMLGPVLAQKRESDRWVGGKIKTKLKAWQEKLLGQSHAAFKLKVLALLFIMAFLALAEGDFRVSAKTAMEGLVQRSVVAPFQGYISQATVRAGDTVTAGQVLATLDDKDLRLEQIRWQSEKEQTQHKSHEAQAKHERASTVVLGAQLNQAEAQLDLIREKLTRSSIHAPFDGVVVSGDLSQLLGAPVEQGKVLFEVAPLDAYRMILKVDERDIVYVRVGQPGQLVLSGLAGNKLDFKVKKITSVSTPEEGVNYFRVEAQLDEHTNIIRPGMEGVGKIDIGQRKLWWIWTRRLDDWFALQFWKWMP